MKIIISLIIVLVFGFITQTNAQFKWPEGKKAAVVFTYDDGSGTWMLQFLNWMSLVLKEHFIVQAIRKVYITEPMSGVQLLKMGTNWEITLCFIHAMAKSSTG
jgi:hypothetical protein